MRADQAGSATAEVSVGGRRLPLAEFLAGCLDPSGDQEPRGDQELVAARLTFLAGGLDALRTAGAPRWTQFGLAGATDEIYGELSSSARELLAGGEITDFFFMHNPPGLRVRFAAAPGRATIVRAELARRARGWRSRGLVTDVLPGVYEPEANLFGGPASMGHVHRLFTVDSLVWLDHHSGIHGQAPSWVVSLLMLRSVFTGPRVSGWWASSDTPLDQWWSDYFATDLARVGPREAAAYYVVFHWNRARLSSGRQSLITAALADDHAC